MKSYILIMIFLSSLLWATGLNFSHRVFLDTYYTDNVLNLSESSLDEFDGGTHPEKYDLETSDDLVTSVRLWLDVKHRYVLGHTSIQRLVLKFEKHWSNDLLDGGYIQLKHRQYLSKSVRVMADYFYYPEIYVNQYIPALKDVADYKEYSYAENAWRCTVEWDVTPALELAYRAEFTQKYYNKYFTEYDASGLKHRLAASYRVSDKLRISGFAAYESDDADGEDAYPDVSAITQIKDASYQENQTGISLDFAVTPSWKITADAQYQMRFYQSDVAGDTYHLGRDDYRTDLRLEVETSQWKNLRIQPWWHLEKREVSSPFAEVKSAKEYVTNEMGVTVRF